MVRIISQGFSTPRSRHSSGEEMIDRFAAMKSLSAVHDDEKHVVKDNCVAKLLDMNCNMDTNDSFSGAESEEDFRAYRSDKDDQNGNCQDPIVFKREQRRERNKLSAQHYRQRHRQQVSAAEKTLEALQCHNKILLDKVQHLETEMHVVETYLRGCVRVPLCTHPHSDNNNHNVNISTIPALAINRQPAVCICPGPSTSSHTSSASHFNSLQSSCIERGPFCCSPADSTLPLNLVAWRPLNIIAEANENNNNVPMSTSALDLTTSRFPEAQICSNNLT